MTVESMNKQHGDSITVDVQTGARSDDQKAPTFEILEQDGKKYLKSSDINPYKQNKIDEITAIQAEIDSALTEIDELDRLEAAEEREGRARELIKKLNDVDFKDVQDVFNFDDSVEFEASYQYFSGLVGEQYQDPSAGFGPTKQPQANTAKQLEQQGRETYRRLRGGK